MKSSPKLNNRLENTNQDCHKEKTPHSILHALKQKAQGRILGILLSAGVALTTSQSLAEPLEDKQIENLNPSENKPEIPDYLKSIKSKTTRAIRTVVLGTSLAITPVSIGMAKTTNDNISTIDTKCQLPKEEKETITWKSLTKGTIKKLIKSDHEKSKNKIISELSDNLKNNHYNKKEKHKLFNQFAKELFETEIADFVKNAESLLKRDYHLIDKLSALSGYLSFTINERVNEQGKTSFKGKLGENKKKNNLAPLQNTQRLSLQPTISTDELYDAQPNFIGMEMKLDLKPLGSMRINISPEGRYITEYQINKDTMLRLKLEKNQYDHQGICPGMKEKLRLDTKLTKYMNFKIELQEQENNRSTIKGMKDVYQLRYDFSEDLSLGLEFEESQTPDDRNEKKAMLVIKKRL